MFEGSIVALVTPMHKGGAIAWDALTHLIEWHIHKGTPVLSVLGSTGEGGLLAADEHAAVIRHTLAAIKKRVPLIVGTGHASTEATIEATQKAMELGADAALIVAPPHVRPTQEGLFQHYKTVAQAVPIPQILYNVPTRTACDILPETVYRLAKIPNIIGIKEATGNVDRARKIIQRVGGFFDFYSGDDSSALEVMAIGAKGVISVTANIVPQRMQALCRAALSDDLATARSIDVTLGDLHDALGIEPNPIPVKWILHKMDLIPEGIRLPLTPLSPERYPAVTLALKTANVGVSLLSA